MFQTRIVLERETEKDDKRTTTEIEKEWEKF